MTRPLHIAVFYICRTKIAFALSMGNLLCQTPSVPRPFWMFRPEWSEISTATPCSCLEARKPRFAVPICIILLVRDPFAACMRIVHGLEKLEMAHQSRWASSIARLAFHAMQAPLPHSWKNNFLFTETIPGGPRPLTRSLQLAQ